MNIKTGLTALITGASSGLGLEFTHILAKEDRWDTILIIARREDRLVKIADLLGQKYPNKKFIYKKNRSYSP